MSRVTVMKEGAIMRLPAARAHEAICGGASLVTDDGAGVASYEAFLQRAGLPHPSLTVLRHTTIEEAEDADDAEPERRDADDS